MGRSIIIGDVHSCAAELEDLLDRVGYALGDRVFFVGDLVPRGPAPLGVLRLLRQVHGRAVLGNHEQRLLAAREARRKGEPGPRLGASHAAVMTELGEEDWALFA